MELCPPKFHIVKCFLSIKTTLIPVTKDTRPALPLHRESPCCCFQIQAKMFYTICIILVLSVSGNLAAPVSCGDLLRPLNEVNSTSLVGRWASVASSLQMEAARADLEGKDSFAIDVRNSSYTMAISSKGQCHYFQRNISLEGSVVTSKVKNFTLTATLLHTSCPDCLVMTFDVQSPYYKSLDFYLMSRRRQVLKEEMEEFMAQLKCLNMRPPIVMDPTMELCPQQLQH